MSSVENDFLTSMKDIEQFKGKWIAILDRKVIAAGEILSKVYQDAIKESGGRTPLFEHIPKNLDKENLIF